MKKLYDKSEKLKIVGVAVVSSEMNVGGGIAYLPSLVTHIIDKAEQTEIVKKQLANPDMDIFSNKKFGEETKDFDFEFSDLVSVDQAKLSQAFGMNIDQRAISAKTNEYITQISNDISADVSPVKNVLIARFRILANELSAYIASRDPNGFMKADIPIIVDEFMTKQNFEDLTASYYIPSENFADLYKGLLLGLLGVYAESYAAMMQSMGIPFNPDTDYIPMNNEMYTATVETYLGMTKIDAAFEAIAIPITDINMKKEVLSKVGNLTAFLSSSFANAFHVDQNAIVDAFQLNFSEEELSRVVTAMFNKKKTSLATNLSALGYQDLDDPTQLSFYFWSFDGKTHFMEFLDNYNESMRSIGNDDKAIEYTDTTGVLMSSVKTIVDAVSYVLIAFVSISLIVSSIMIGVITYISVYERTKEIGILRAIGASKHNISSIFNAETFIVGFLSGALGIIISYLLIPPINLILHHFTGDIPLSAELDPRTAGLLIVLSVVLTLIAGLIPSKSASKKDPVEALRSE